MNYVQINRLRWQTIPFLFQAGDDACWVVERHDLQQLRAMLDSCFSSNPDTELVLHGFGMVIKEISVNDTSATFCSKKFYKTRFGVLFARDGQRWIQTASYVDCDPKYFNYYSSIKGELELYDNIHAVRSYIQRLYKPIFRAKQAFYQHFSLLKKHEHKVRYPDLVNNWDPVLRIFDLTDSIHLAIKNAEHSMSDLIVGSLVSDNKARYTRSVTCNDVYTPEDLQPPVTDLINKLNTLGPDYAWELGFDSHELFHELPLYVPVLQFNLLLDLFHQFITGESDIISQDMINTTYRRIALCDYTVSPHFLKYTDPVDCEFCRDLIDSVYKHHPSTDVVMVGSYADYGRYAAREYKNKMWQDFSKRRAAKQQKEGITQTAKKVARKVIADKLDTLAYQGATRDALSMIRQAARPVSKYVKKRVKKRTQNRRRRKTSGRNNTDVLSRANKHSVQCVSEYYNAIKYPNLNVPICLPTRGTTSSWKSAWTDKLIVYSGTDGTGFFAMAPTFCSGTAAYYTTTTAYASQAITLAATLPTGVNQTNSNSLISTTSFLGAVNSARIVGVSLTVMNRSNNLNVSGSFFMGESSAHTTINGLDETGASNVPRVIRRDFRSLEKENVFIMPLNIPHSVGDTSEEQFYSSNNTTTTYSPYYPWSETFTVNSARGDPCIFAAIFGATATCSYEVSVTTYCEYTGPTFRAHEASVIVNENDYAKLCAYYDQYRADLSRY